MYSNLFNEAGFLESLVDAVLVHGAQALGRDRNGDGFIELRDKHTLLLEVDLLALHPRGVELGSTNTVGVASTHY